MRQVGDGGDDDNEDDANCCNSGSIADDEYAYKLNK